MKSAIDKRYEEINGEVRDICERYLKTRALTAAEEYKVSAWRHELLREPNNRRAEAESASRRQLSSRKLKDRFLTALMMGDFMPRPDKQKIVRAVRGKMIENYERGLALLVHGKKN